MAKVRVSKELSMKIPKTFVGLAGEYLVLSRLTALGLLASLTPRNAETVDIFVMSKNGDISWTIQVKSRLYGPDANEWEIDESFRNNSNPNLIYCFVDLYHKPATVYVIPSKKVAEVASEAHSAWMKKPKRDGTKRTLHSRPKLKDNFIVDIKSAPDGWMKKYWEKWDIFSE